ncbi:MAG TPA: ABC transporter permease subunit [Anaerolineales bacterium]|jgi:phosphonate ABC transporter permease subunit PhnE|nr:ABC transporter permease subunit [Anaerolineales bacterium]
MNNRNGKKATLWKSIQIGLAVLAGLLIYAYGFQITQVDLEDLRSERRQESLVRVMRALARPEIFEYEQEVEVINAPVHVPCPAGGIEPASEAGSEGPYIVVSPGCAAPGETVQVEGFNFAPNTSGPLRFVPGSDPANPVAIGRDSVETDESGHFVHQMVLPARESEDVQYIRASLRQNVGAPRFTDTAKDTWDKIIETVFLALLATTFGTILAIPLSFIAARNLMKPVKSPLASIALSVLGWPIGIVLGYLVVKWVEGLSVPLSQYPLANLIAVIVSIILAGLGIRWALPQEETTTPPPNLRLARLGVLILVILVSFFGFFQLASLAKNLGILGASNLGPFNFLGNFLFQVGDILGIITPALGGLAAGGVLSSWLGRFGQRSTERLAPASVKLLNIIFSTLAGAITFGLIGQLVEWLYQIGRPAYTLWAPLIIGGLLGLALAVFTNAKTNLSIGMVIYYVTRTILNGLRSIEALVMAIVFVIAVGIGPFAGMMALGLHTIVSLAKLYSEQVESISAGPMEAVQATGANRLQTIIYAVIPQIIPPYISYTMYRWDINVRMSTIIGFVGGGGIGFLLQQNINLLNYRAASAQMLAIAIVVASMDYISSVLREKYV